MLVRIPRGQILLLMGAILLARGSVGYDTYVFSEKNHIRKILSLFRAAAFLLVVYHGNQSGFIKVGL